MTAQLNCKICKKIPAIWVLKHKKIRLVSDSCLAAFQKQLLFWVPHPLGKEDECSLISETF